MENISSVNDLRIAIQLLENEQMFKAQQLKEQFFVTYEHFKPVNLIKSTLNDVTESPYLVSNILGAVTALATGYLTKKAVIGRSANLFRRLVGGIIQFGVTNLIARHPDDVMKISNFVLDKIFSKKEKNPSDDDA